MTTETALTLSTIDVKWERSKLFCPNCGNRGLWIMVDRQGTYPCACELCRESCEIDPWRAYDIPESAVSD